MVHRLLLRQFADRRQDSEGISRQNTIADGFTSHAWSHDVVNHMNRVSCPRVFSIKGIIIIGFACIFINNDIFENRPEADRVKDLRLLFLA